MLYSDVIRKSYLIQNSSATNQISARISRWLQFSPLINFGNLSLLEAFYRVEASELAYKCNFKYGRSSGRTDHHKELGGPTCP